MGGEDGAPREESAQTGLGVCERPAYSSPHGLNNSPRKLRVDGTGRTPEMCLSLISPRV
jgi:hypothetical protein